MTQRATRQLAAVYDVLVASRDHPTAEQVFRRVRDMLPRVSLGTVYRNLDKLREQGRLRVVRLASGEAHYDAITVAHDHFVCERCRIVLDLDGAPPPPAARRLRDDGCVVHWHTTALYGLCGDCAADPSAARPPAGAGQAA
jgi:Fe2+ or Zn2+ uptake regulation protein